MQLRQLVKPSSHAIYECHCLKDVVSGWFQLHYFEVSQYIFEINSFLTKKINSFHYIDYLFLKFYLLIYFLKIFFLCIYSLKNKTVHCYVSMENDWLSKEWAQRFQLLFIGHEIMKHDI